MGARLSSARWFRDECDLDIRQLVSQARNEDLERRLDDLTLLNARGVLEGNEVFERVRVREELERRRREAMLRQRCPLCGGWATGQFPWAARTLQKCVDCGWMGQVFSGWKSRGPVLVRGRLGEGGVTWR